jgi:pyruvate/2-oxoglutarate dehydrogenase complex dihydrolipoamide dehydrogenase (E3) component
MSDYDVIVIGSGAGGGTLVHRLAPSGNRILLLERGDWLPNWVHACVGGATKLYGAAPYRLRAEDFGERQHHAGTSPA